VRLDPSTRLIRAQVWALNPGVTLRQVPISVVEGKTCEVLFSPLDALDSSFYSLKEGS
jgi:hypothetical protein